MISSTEMELKNNKDAVTSSTGDPCLHFFQEDISGYLLPEKFTNPFDYQPHPLCLIAAKELQCRIETLPHIFVNENGEKDSLGKMFGVLVVKDLEGRLAYLTAFSGKLFGGNKIEGFVPPIFDTLNPDGFYKKGEEEITRLNILIKALEEEPDYLRLKEDVVKAHKEFVEALAELKTQLKQRKVNRDLIRSNLQQKEGLSESILQKLNDESSGDHYQLKDFKKLWKAKLENLEKQFSEMQKPIEELKIRRKKMSADLQHKLHQEYYFLNALGERKNLMDIFDLDDDHTPPSGAGECAAPKLLHYAYVRGYQLIAMAEFWWGVSPASEIRKHGHYYPSCKSKCKPILTHMLAGLSLEDSPIKENVQPKEVAIIYEDDHLIVVNKPEGLLSVPGKEIHDSVQTRMKTLHPSITSPMIVHRLDMATSGLMVLAKDLHTYHHLQAQFTHKKIVKKYEAILDGEITQTIGEINLPLRVDLDNRPRQLVCYTHGKPSLTRYEVRETKNKKTLIDFYPVTGRSHQLRVHSAHKEGLNTAILGDDLYGRRADRLYLHAAYLQFVHPRTKEKMVFTMPSGFEL